MPLGMIGRGVGRRGVDMPTEFCYSLFCGMAAAAELVGCAIYCFKQQLLFLGLFWEDFQTVSRWVFEQAVFC